MKWLKKSMGIKDIKKVEPQESDLNYNDHYRQYGLNVYPSEFAIRAFMGEYPGHKIEKDVLAGRRVLDLGFGDGRNFHLLANLSMQLYGVEVTDYICKLVTDRLSIQGIKLDAREGRNQNIPFANDFFDYILASNSCYYIDPGTHYSDNIKEITRALKPDGLFIHSLPMPTTFIMEDAVDIGDGHMQITKDPYGVRVGAILKKFDNEQQIIDSLSKFYTDIKIGSVHQDFWGSKVHLWLVIAKKLAI